MPHCGACRIRTASIPCKGIVLPITPHTPRCDFCICLKCYYITTTKCGRGTFFPHLLHCFRKYHYLVFLNISKLSFRLSHAYCQNIVLRSNVTSPLVLLVAVHTVVSHNTTDINAYLHDALLGRRNPWSMASDSNGLFYYGLVMFYP